MDLIKLTETKLFRKHFKHVYFKQRIYIFNKLLATLFKSFQKQ